MTLVTAVYIGHSLGFGTEHLMRGKWMWRSVTVIHDLPFSGCFFKAAYSTLNESRPI